VKADGGGSASRPPASKHQVQALPHLPEVLEFPIQVRPLPQHQIVNVRAWQAPRSLDRDDLLNLVQTEAEALRLTDECQQVQRFHRIDAVAGGSALGGGEDARLLVQPERLPCRPGALRDLTDQQPVPAHGNTLNPAPRGRVKDLS
jgi:hypothetical protein